MIVLLAGSLAAVAGEAADPCAQASTEDGETPGEPTERDLCLALASKYQGVDRNLNQMKESGCGDMNRNRNDTMAAMMCLGASMAGAGGGPQISLAGFRKIACVSPRRAASRDTSAMSPPGSRMATP